MISNNLSVLTVDVMSERLYRNTRRTRYVFSVIFVLLKLLTTITVACMSRLYKLSCSRIGRIVSVVVICHLLNYLAMRLYMNYCASESSYYHIIMELIYGKSYHNPVCKQLLIIIYFTNNKVFQYLTGTHFVECWFSMI